MFYSVVEYELIRGKKVNKKMIFDRLLGEERFFHIMNHKEYNMIKIISEVSFNVYSLFLFHSFI